MHRPQPGPSGETEAESGPRLVATFRRTPALAAQWVVVSGISFFAFGYAFAGIRAAILGTSLEPIVVPAFSAGDALVPLAVFAAVMALVVIPHELLHGVFMARYGGDPEYGVGLSRFALPYAYAGTEGVSYTRNQLLVTLLAPFVGITAVGLAVLVVSPSPLVVAALAANAAGSIGDLWMAGALLQYPSHVRVGELPDSDVQGFGVYAAPDRDATPPAGRRVLARAVAGAVGTLAVVVVALVGTVFVSLAAGSGTVVIGDPNGRWFLLRHELHPRAGVAYLEVGASLLSAVAAGGGLGWALLRTGLAARLSPPTGPEP